MKQNPSFTLKEIAGVPYLLPFGQMIADHKRGLKTNATGVYLWNLLAEEHSQEEVLSKSAAYYGVSAEELSSFREDITQFLKQLLFLGILVDSDKIRISSTDTPHRIQTSREAASSLEAHGFEPASSTAGTLPLVEHMLSIGDTAATDNTYSKFFHFQILLI